MVCERPIKVRSLMRDQKAHVMPLVRHFGSEAEFLFDEEWAPSAIQPNTTDLVLCVNDFSYEIAQCIDAARLKGIPTLTLQDGTLDWRCQYENSIFAAGGGPAQHQPVLSDKIACLGPQSARHIAMWGNAAKVEITGMPKMDQLLDRPASSPARGRKRRLLVMTAKKPWFDESQRSLILCALCDLRDYLNTRPDIEVAWRLTKNIELEIGVTNTLNELESMELVEVLDSVDAVVSTPSTAIIEAMLCRRPVAALDYHNSPRFLPTAWTISCPGHVASTINEMLMAPPAKMLFQQTCLTDVLRIDGPAAPRVAELIRRMVAVARDCRMQSVPLSLPANQLEFGEIVVGSKQTPLSAIYPFESIYGDDDVTSLQARLIRAQKDLAKLHSSLADRSFSYWIAACARYMRRQFGKNRQ